jgi:hypothetical protein
VFLRCPTYDESDEAADAKDAKTDVMHEESRGTFNHKNNFPLLHGADCTQKAFGETSLFLSQEQLSTVVKVRAEISKAVACHESFKRGLFFLKAFCLFG